MDDVTCELCHRAFDSETAYQLHFSYDVPQGVGKVRWSTVPTRRLRCIRSERGVATIRPSLKGLVNHAWESVTGLRDASGLLVLNESQRHRIPGTAGSRTTRPPITPSTARRFRTPSATAVCAMLSTPNPAPRRASPGPTIALRSSPWPESSFPTRREPEGQSDPSARLLAQRSQEGTGTTDTPGEAIDSWS